MLARYFKNHESYIQENAENEILETTGNLQDDITLFKRNANNHVNWKGNFRELYSTV